jgi:hypothetical protein
MLLVLLVFPFPPVKQIRIECCSIFCRGMRTRKDTRRTLQGDMARFIGETGASHGTPRLVLLAVDPTLLHAYWEVPAEDLELAGEDMEEARPVLRLYEVGREGAEQPPGWFDVEILLPSRNWYVHLWSAGKSYYAELGLRRADGVFVHIVRSKVVHMPRAWPVAVPQEHFMRMNVAERRADFVRPPAVVIEKQEQTVAEAEPVTLPESDSERGTEPGAAVPTPSDSPQTLKRKLEEFYAYRLSAAPPRDEIATREQSTVAAEREGATAGLTSNPRQEEHHRIDLTAAAEDRLTMGLSSGALQDRDRDT